MKVGSKIRELRERKKLSQENMADMLGMSISGYGKIERDESQINLEKLDEIALKLDTTPEEIICSNSNNFTNHGTANDKSFSVINEYSSKVEKLLEENIKLYKEKIISLEQKIAELEKASK